MYNIASTLLALVFIVSFHSSDLQAQEYNLQKVQEWTDKEDLLGSPLGYRYLARYKNVEVYSSDNEMVLSKKLKGNEKVYSSPKGHFWGAATFVDRSAQLLKVTEFSLYTPAGKLLYTLKDPGALKFILNDNAANIVGIAGTEGLPQTTLKFYDESGNHIRDLEFANYLGGEFSADGNLFFALSADSGLYAISPKGEAVYNINVGKPYAIGNDGRLIMACNSGNLELYFQKNMTNSASLALDDPWAVMLSADNRLALVMSQKKALCYSIPELEILWEYELGDARDHFNSCDYSPELGLFAFGIALDNGPDYSFTDRYTEGRAEIVSPDGEILGSGSVSYNSWSTGFPLVRFGNPDNSLWVITHYSLFKVPLN
jgi:hypothetical protein